MNKALGGGPTANVAARFLQEAIFHPSSLGLGIDTQDGEVALLKWLWISTENVDLVTLARRLFHFASCWHPYVQSCTHRAIVWNAAFTALEKELRTTAEHCRGWTWRHGSCACAAVTLHNKLSCGGSFTPCI